MRNLGSILALLATLAVGHGPPNQIQRLRWLAGCWKVDENGRRVQEEWTDGRGGLMLGTSRTFRDARVVDYEFAAIHADSAGKLVFEAYPSRQKPATFALAFLSDTAVSFANPAHDFPTTIGYARRGRDSVIALVEGPGGKQIRFPYRRTACPGDERSR